MSQLREALASMRALLADERRAIRALDGQAIEAAALAKERLAVTLGDLPAGDLAEVREELHAMRAELRRNGILLAHARACLRELNDIGRERYRVTGDL